MGCNSKNLKNWQQLSYSKMHPAISAITLNIFIYFYFIYLIFAQVERASRVHSRGNSTAIPVFGAWPYSLWQSDSSTCTCTLRLVPFGYRYTRTRFFGARVRIFGFLEKKKSWKIVQKSTEIEPRHDVAPLDELCTRPYDPWDPGITGWDRN